jgi:hypothetical protein
MTPIEHLRARARALHKAVRRGEPEACARLRALRELHACDDSQLAAQVRRRHCLSLIARELGFAGWPHAVAVIGGERADDFGTLLYPRGQSAHWNIWSADYDEARAIRTQHGGYLLAYKKHFLIVDRYFIETLGLDPDDADWERIGRDWVQPVEREARDRLYLRLLTTS